MMVSEAKVRDETSGLLSIDWPGISDTVLGWKVRSEGAVPVGRVWALNSGAASLPTFTPGACWTSLAELNRRGKRDVHLWWHGIHCGERESGFLPVHS